MNTDNFLIEKNDIERAHNICNLIVDSDTRNRAVANVIGADIAVKFFDPELYEVDVKSGLHNIAVVLDDIDISDIYIKNSYIDVRLFFDDDNLSVPKAHFDNQLLPAAYMFIKISADLSGAEVVGFLLPENVDTSNAQGDFYSVSEESLISFYDVDSRIVNVEDLYNVEEKEIFDYLDGKLEDKNSFYRKLILSPEGRTKLAKAAKAKYIFDFISTPQVNDYVQNDEVMYTAADDKGLDLQMEGDDELLPENNDLELTIDTDDAGNVDIFDELNDGLDVEDSNVDNLSFENITDDSEENLEFIDDEADFADEDINSIGAEPFDINDSEIQDGSENIEEISQDNSYSFTTNTTPSVDSDEVAYEELLNDENNVNEIISEQPVSEEKTVSDGELLENTSKSVSAPDVAVRKSGNGRDRLADDSKEDIEALFSSEDDKDASEISVQKTKNNGVVKLLAVVALLAVLGGAGYFGYSKMNTQNAIEDDMQTNLISDKTQAENSNTPADTDLPQDAMPIETVNTTEPKSVENEGNAVSIPMIEQNLDASILVSNLKVDWEVPAGYASNSSAKRYLVKLGKIIQLNLKTELLLLNKPPLTNKIAIEIKYNSDSKKFETVDIVTSSGEEAVDKLIRQTVDRALAMNLNMNTNSFSKLQGNPVLVIRL